MKADIEYFYVADYSPEVRVVGNIEGVKLNHRETQGFAGQDPDPKWEVLTLSPADARELAEMLNKSADHVDDLNRNSSHGGMPRR